MNYAQAATNADRQLAKAGQQITVSRYAPTRNSSTGVTTKGTATLTGTTYAVEIPATAGLIEAFSISLEAGSLTAKTIRALKVSALLGFRPAPRDEVTFADGSIWPVVGCTFVSPSGTDIIYTLGIAK